MKNLLHLKCNMKPLKCQHFRSNILHLWCKMLSSDQIRGARAILRLGQAELAESADVSLETVKRIESMEGELRIRLDTLTKIKTALEKAGIEFIAENGGGPGVRLRKAKR
jgi:DNA-binding XRE family transcriptional regulator